MGFNDQRHSPLRSETGLCGEVKPISRAAERAAAWFHHQVTDQFTDYA